MRRTVFGTAVGLILLTAVGCGSPTHESLAQDLIGKMKELNATLHDITDENSAKKAAPKIDSIVADVNRISEKVKALPKLTPEEDKALQAKHEKEVKEVQSSLMGEMMRVMMKPDLAKPIQESMKKFKPMN